MLFIIILMSKLITKLDLPQLCHTLDPALCHRLTFRTGDEIVNPLLGWSVWCDEICLWYSYTSISPWKELDFLRCSYIQWNISLFCLLCIFRLFFWYIVYSGGYATFGRSSQSVACIPIQILCFNWDNRKWWIIWQVSYCRNRTWFNNDHLSMFMTVEVITVALWFWFICDYC